MSTVAALTDARQLICEGWCKFEARTLRRGVQHYCALSALRAACGSDALTRDAAFMALRAELPYGTSVYVFNDHPNTTHDGVIALYDRAIKAVSA